MIEYYHLYYVFGSRHGRAVFCHRFPGLRKEIGKGHMEANCIHFCYCFVLFYFRALGSSLLALRSSRAFSFTAACLRPYMFANSMQGLQGIGFERVEKEWNGYKKC